MKDGLSKQNRPLLEMVKMLLRAEVAFEEIFNKYKKGTLHFSDIGHWIDDKGESLLYNLKEQSHALFRTGQGAPIRRDEWLLDLVIGSIFHEAMKLRENIYQMEVYGPRYLQFKTKTARPLQAYEKDYLLKFERIISRAKAGVEHGMEEIHSFFRDAMEQLVGFFKKNSKDPHLVRLLLDNRTLLRRVYGHRRTEEIFRVMFKRGPLDAYRIAGRSYLKSGHYDLSSLYFSRALKLNPADVELRFLLNFSLGMKAYYENAYRRVFSHFGKLVALGWNGRLKRDYLKRAEGVCREIASELKEEHQVKRAAQYEWLADQIKKVLS